MYIFLISLCLKIPRVLIFWNLSLHLKLIATEVCILSISTMCSKMIIFLFQMFLMQKNDTLCKDYGRRCCPQVYDSQNLLIGNSLHVRVG